MPSAMSSVPVNTSKPNTSKPLPYLRDMTSHPAQQQRKRQPRENKNGSKDSSSSSSSNNNNPTSTTTPTPKPKPKTTTTTSKPPPPPNRHPIIHSLYEPTTQIWQYIIACPLTSHCVLIDPVREHTPEEVQISTTNADALLALIAARKYTVTHILETNASPRPFSRSAAWYMRMQLLDSQGFAPLYLSGPGGGTAGALTRLFDRKYGDRARLAPSLVDGAGEGFEGEEESVVCGKLRVYKMDLPGFSTPKRRAYIIGPHVFGAHGVAMGLEEQGSSQEDGAVLGMKERHARDARLWASIQTVLSMPEAVKIFFDCGAPMVEFNKGPFDTIGRCRSVNRYVGLDLQGFVVRREGERRVLEDAPMRISGEHGRKKSGSGSATNFSTAAVMQNKKAPYSSSNSTSAMKTLGFAKKKSQRFPKQTPFNGEWSDQARLIGGARGIAV
jgi:hypothetical protein